jgi:DNA-binding transcriptional LysR family regulator
MDVLRTLVVATDLGGFGKAAARLGRTQPAISLQMKRLEDQVGETIFRKQGRGVMLTDAGDILLGYARRIIALNDEAMSATRGIGMQGTVRLGLPQDFAEKWLRTVLLRFHRTQPNIYFEVHCGRTRDLQEQVLRGSLDIALAFGEANSFTQASDVIAHLPIVWVGSQEFDRKKHTTTLPLAVLDAPCVFRERGIGALVSAGQSWRISFCSHSLAGLWGAVDAGLGITARTLFEIPDGLRILDKRSDLPELGTISLALYLSPRGCRPFIEQLQAIIVEHLLSSSPEGTLFPGIVSGHAAQLKVGSGHVALLRSNNAEEGTR